MWEVFSHAVAVPEMRDFVPARRADAIAFVYYQPRGPAGVAAGVQNDNESANLPSLIRLGASSTMVLAGMVVLPFCAVGSAAIVVSIRIGGIEFDGFNVVGNGVINVTLRAIGNTAAVVGAREVSIDFDRFGVVLQELRHIDI